MSSPREEKKEDKKDTAKNLTPQGEKKEKEPFAEVVKNLVVDGSTRRYLSVRKFWLKLCKRPGVLMMLFIAVGFFTFVVGLVIMSNFMEKCISEVMPCPMDSPGSCRCSIRAADGSCWRRMTPAMRCYRSNMVIKWGICQGVYETKLCGTTQDEVDGAMEAIATAVTELHPTFTGTCNMAYERENDRCRLPVPRMDLRPFEASDCCRSPLQTCELDIDCCNCGQESPLCSKPLRCISSQLRGNATSGQTDCELNEDACVSFSFPGCTGEVESCFSQDLDTGRSPQSQECCSQGICTGTDVCRPQCNVGGLLEGCPCVTDTTGYCIVRQCVSTPEFFQFGGVEKYLRDRGATRISLCKTDNCNQ